MGRVPLPVPLASSTTVPPDPLAQRMQLLIESVVDYAIFMLDPRGHVMSWNSGAQRLKGYTRDEIIGTHFSAFYPPETAQSGWPQEELRRADRLGRFEDEGWRVRKDGSRFWANVVITALREPDGRLAGFGKVTRDLTERRRNEEALRASEERFRLLVDSVRDYAIFMLDASGRVMSWNAGAQAIKGYSADQVLGHHFSMFYPPQDKALADTLLERARTQGRCAHEGWRMRRDGRLFWANVVLTAVHQAGGELIGFAKVTRDMTERRKLEELERSSRRINEFLAVLAHELRNPLAPIRNAVTIMQLEPLASPGLRHCRDVIDRQLAQVTHLVDDLLDMGRLNTGKVRLRQEQVRLADVAARSAEAARPLMDARRHQLRLELPAEPVWVAGDTIRLVQVVQNLLLNAARYTPEGGQIVLRLAQDRGFATVSVTDTGRGLAAADLERIFDLFVQGEDVATAPAGAGLGIGLTLARSLAELHGGTLDASSPGPGLGSTFTLRLPALAAQAPPPAGPAAQGGPGAGDAPGLRILVVDDNRDSAESTCEILRLLGHEAVCAYDGSAALEAAPGFGPQVVMLDLAMPGMDGYETRRRLQALPGMAQACYIAITGFGNDEDHRRTAQAGFAGHLTKPVELEALLALLRTASPA